MKCLQLYATRKGAGTALFSAYFYWCALVLVLAVLIFTFHLPVVEAGSFGSSYREYGTLSD